MKMPFYYELEQMELTTKVSTLKEKMEYTKEQFLNTERFFI